MKRNIHYAWIVLLLAFIALLSAQGVRLSFGAFITPWEDEFHTNRGVISLISFISYAVFGLSQPYIGKLIDQHRTSPSEKGTTAYGEVESTKIEIKKNEQKESVSILKLFKTKPFLFLLLPFFVCGVTTSGLIDTHLIPFAQVCGFSPTLTGTAVSLLAAFNILGTIVSGHLADRLSCKNMLSFLYGARAISIAILLIIVHETSFFNFFISQSYLLLLFAISFGIVDFATVAPTVKLATEYFKHLSVGVVIGWLFLSHQIGSAIGSYIPGLLYDVTGNYDISFIYSIILLLGASALSFLLPAVVNNK
jgi:predicted MFS family arabinose efflux permease